MVGNPLAFLLQGGIKGLMFPVFLTILMCVLPGLPLWMKSVFRRTALLSNQMQFGVYVGFQTCLAISVFLTFFLTWFTFFLTHRYLAGYVTGISVADDFWDGPLTPRGALFLVFLLTVPFFVFTKIGLVSIRDVHQICKEQRDRVEKRRKAGWKGL